MSSSAREASTWYAMRRQSSAGNGWVDFALSAGAVLVPDLDVVDMALQCRAAEHGMGGARLFLASAILRLLQIEPPSAPSSAKENLKWFSACLPCRMFAQGICALLQSAAVDHAFDPVLQETDVNVDEKSGLHTT